MLFCFLLQLCRAEPGLPHHPRLQRLAGEVEMFAVWSAAGQRPSLSQAVNSVHAQAEEFGSLTGGEDLL